MAGHIFISYARSDGRVQAQRLYEALIGRGHAAWRDQCDLDPYQDSSVEIETAIEGARHVVVCLTPQIASSKDSFVRREIIYAQGCAKPITPILFPGFPEGKIPVHINHLTWLRFYDPETPMRLNFEEGFEALLSRIAESGTHVPSTVRVDPFQNFLYALYKEIVAHLQVTVFSLLSLQSEAVPEAVRSTRHPSPRALPVSFFAQSLPLIEDALEAPQPARSFASFEDAFNHYGGRLLLLGPPGSGKTTTLLAFAREAAARRLEDAREPLPLVAKAADWVADGTPDIAAWIARHNGLDAAAVQAEIRADRVLLLLDGLDEATSALGKDRSTRDIIAAINGWPEGIRTVVSCRAAEYHAMESRLALKGAVTLSPLSDLQIAEYLADSPDLQSALSNDPQLHDIARTPLLLGHLAYAYKGLGSNAEELRTFGAGPAETRDRIFGTFVRRCYEHERLKPHASPPVDLEQLYDALGLAAFQEVDMSAFIQSLGYTHADAGADWGAHAIDVTLRATLGDRADSVIDEGRRLHLLRHDTQGRLQFVHSLLGDHFALPFAIARVQSDDQRDAVRAAYVLGRLGDPRGVPGLADAFSRNASGLLSAVAGRALGRIEGISPEAGSLVPLLEQAAGKDDPHSRATLAEVVGAIQVRAATDQQQGEHWKSIGLLERARELIAPRTDLDRALALALGGRAELVMRWCDGLTLFPPDDVLQVVLTDLEQATRVDSTLPDPFWDLAVVHARFRGDYLRAERFLQKARDIGYSHPMLPWLIGVLQARSPLARPPVTDSIRLREVLLRVAIQAVGPLASGLRDEQPTRPVEAATGAPTFGDHLARAQAIAARDEIPDDQYLRMVVDSRRSILSDAGQYVADLLRRLAELRGVQPVLDRATENHLQILRDTSFAVMASAKNAPKRMRIARRVAARGLGIAGRSRASISPDLHADLLLASGQALYYENPANVARAVRTYHEALRLKRAAGNGPDAERLADLLRRQIDYRVAASTATEDASTREILALCREIAEDLDDPVRVEQIGAAIERLDGMTS